MLAFAGRSAFLAGVALSVLALSVAGAASRPLDRATGYEPVEPNGVVEVAQGYVAGESGSGGPQADSAGLVLRIDRLESQVRQLTGQVEQLQFTARKLEDQLKKFQEDVEFRFQESGGHGGTPPSKPLQRRSKVEEPEAGGGETSTGMAEPAETGTAKTPARRSDAFDPASDPVAPGAPRPLGSPGSTRPPRSATASAGLDAGDPDAPLDLSGAKLRARKEPAPTATNEPPSETSSRPAPPAPSRPAGAPATEIGAAPPRPATDPVKEEYDLALGLMKQKEYESAERSLAAFLQKNPRSKLASDALYYLGESFFQRGRQREAAEQYLKVSTQYASSQRAPEAFLRLGQSLSSLGAKEQACAAYAKIEHEYPNASASVRSGAEREAKRARC
jgi:tol-pal system protein YbgF